MVPDQRWRHPAAGPVTAPAGDAGVGARHPRDPEGALVPQPTAGAIVGRRSWAGFLEENLKGRSGW